MKRAPSRPTFSGFAQFATKAARTKFVRATLDPNPKLKDRAYCPETRPTIVFEALTANERDRLQEAIADVGQWFDDVQFQTM